MKRLVSISVLAFFSAFAATGCFSQTVVQGDDQSDQTSQGAHVATSTNDETAVVTVGAPTQLLELNLHLTPEDGKPHPEPWLRQQKPHPEPWAAILQSDPTSSEPTKP
jgi:hypothetical protein